MRQPSEQPPASAGRSTKLHGPLLSAVLVVLWAIAVFTLHSDQYDVTAVVASIAVLAGALAVWHWRPQPEWETGRGVVLACFGFGFAFSGMPVIIAFRPDPSAPPISPEALSSSTLANVLWAAAFSFGLISSLLVFAPPRHRSPHATEELERPRFPVLVALVSGVVWLLMAVVATREGSALRSVGGLPMMLLPPTLIVPIFAAGSVKGERSAQIALAVTAFIHLVLTLYTSMLGWVATFIALLLLTYATLRKWPARKYFLPLLIAPAALVFVLNPVKAEVRQRRIDDDTVAIEPSKVLTYWKEALEGTWGNEDGDGDGEESGGSALERTNYNVAGAPVFQSVPDYLPFEEGATYEDILPMFIPRIFYPEKISNNVIRTKWTIKLGVMSREGSERTAVAVPSPAEAYWNFGWPGVIWIPFMLGAGCRLLLAMAPKSKVAATSFAVMVGFVVANPTDMLFNLLPSIPTLVLGSILLRLFVELPRNTRDSTSGRIVSASVPQPRSSETN